MRNNKGVLFLFENRFFLNIFLKDRWGKYHQVSTPFSVSNCSLTSLLNTIYYFTMSCYSSFVGDCIRHCTYLEVLYESLSLKCEFSCRTYQGNCISRSYPFRLVTTFFLRFVTTGDVPPNRHLNWPFLILPWKTQLSLQDIKLSTNPMYLHK